MGEILQKYEEWKNSIRENWSLEAIDQAIQEHYVSRGLNPDGTIPDDETPPNREPTLGEALDRFMYAAGGAVQEQARRVDELEERSALLRSDVDDLKATRRRDFPARQRELQRIEDLTDRAASAERRVAQLETFRGRFVYYTIAVVTAVDVLRILLIDGWLNR